MRLILVLALLLMPGFAQSGNTADPTLDRLAKTGMFAFGGVGIAGTISQGEKDYRIILSRPTAMADFEKLFATGTPEAKAYALTGIHALDPDKFEELSLPLRNSKIELQTASGCILYKKTLASVLAAFKNSSAVPEKKLASQK